MSTSTKISPLRQLANIISDAVAQIDEKYTSANRDFPPLDKPFNEKDPACQLLSSPDVAPLASLIVAAADQLVVSVRNPVQAVFDIAESHTTIACLRLACEANIAEILREAGPQGLHVKDIAAKNKLHPGKIGRGLRLLATHHVFDEISPDVFANNRLSSILDTGKSVDSLMTRPKVEKFKGVGASYCALVEAGTDLAMKGSAYIADSVLDPATALSEEPSAAPFLRAFKKNFIEYLFAPGNEYQGARFHAGMMTFAISESLTAVPGGFPWEALPKGTRIVDVGGGVGSACHEIMKKNRHLKFIVQDLPGVTAQAIEYWNHNEPKAIADGQVTIRAHDFFTPQPVDEADIFLLRFVLHDWSNAKATEVLKRLREGAIPGKTKIVVIDAVVHYTCAVDWKRIRGAEDIAFEGSDKESAVPAGLLPNRGRGEARYCASDLMMLAMNNGQERTIGDYVQVTEASGWKIQKIYSPEGKKVIHVLAEAV